MGRGGSEARAMWLLQALKNDFEVTLLTTRNVDLDALNRFYGTSVQPGEIKIRVAPVPFFMKNNSSIAALRGAFYSRSSKKIGHEYDLCISSYNLSDWGVPSLHFIADFVWDRNLANVFDPIPDSGAKMIHKDNILRKMYIRACRVLEGGYRCNESFFDGSEYIISNSLWSAKILKEKYNYCCDQNIYPAVVSEFRNVPWENKANTFVSIGRIAPEKRVEQQIDILERVRALGHDICFHLIGGIPDDSYGQMIRNRCRKKSWIRLEGRKNGPEKEQLLTGAKFAIHTRPHEAFGIAVAELVKAGCIPFIPDTGGQTEIVPFEELQFSTVEDAVHKIDDILRNDSAQEQILKKLAGQKPLFSAEQFCEQARAVINNWFANTDVSL